MSTSFGSLSDTEFERLTALGPHIIGATGGSGTRVFARAVQRGVYLGARLNASEDALDFVPFLDRWVNRFWADERRGASDPLRRRMCADFRSVLARHCAPLADVPARELRWGWKEPRSIFMLPFWAGQFPRIKFLHVVRDGRDMAYSTNQNQLRKHGRAVLTWRERLAERPVRSIILWARVNTAAADFGERFLRDRYLRVRLEDLCADPTAVMCRVFNFFALPSDGVRDAARLVTPPRTLGRWRAADIAQRERLHRIAASALSRFGYLD